MSQLAEFEQYLVDHHVEVLQVSLSAKVRYVTVWNAAKGKPVSRENAQKIVAAAQHLTGTPYLGPFTIASDEPVK
jgi:hypothetical protein